MKVVLRKDVDRLGKKGDIIEVADGFARNYLLPRGHAFQASGGVMVQASAMRRSRDLRDSKDRESAELIARTLVSKTVTVTAKAGPEGKLFGSVTSAEIADAVQAQAGVELDRRKLVLDDSIKTIGTHEVVVKLHADVQFPLSVEVVDG
ncbi:MAG: 50S ribosomal protein L9 [Acidimicrobiales bacterium]